MKIALVYIHPSKVAKYIPYTKRFVETYLAHSAEFPHDLIVLCNGGEPESESKKILSQITCRFEHHDNSGWDIGGYQAASHLLKNEGYDLMVGANATVYFHRSGWLSRMVSEYEANGSGHYGAHGSFEYQPHIRPSFFWLPPQLLAMYPWKISDRKKAFDFEYRDGCFTQWTESQGYGSFTVTWDGCYSKADWRKAPNIYRRGTQENCLVLDRHCDAYRNEKPVAKKILGKLADGHKCYLGKIYLLARSLQCKWSGATHIVRASDYPRATSPEA